MHVGMLAYDLARQTRGFAPFPRSNMRRKRNPAAIVTRTSLTPLRANTKKNNSLLPIEKLKERFYLTICAKNDSCSAKNPIVFFYTA